MHENDDRGAYQFTFDSLAGNPVPLKDFAGKALLVVNTASRCGFTPQYDGLQALWLARKKDGLVVLGVPSNDFANQEPGTADIISTFCTERQVTFPIMAKTNVIGPDAHPFYKWVAKQTGFAGRPRWNFYKYLIDGDGKLVSWFSSMTKPSSPALRKAIDKALK